jgi:hypothetical protein
MRVRLSEQANPRYIYVDQATNTVHLLVPVTLGTEVALDNTCKTVLALQEFFGKKSDSEQRQDSARHELLRFVKALELDIDALPETDSEIKRLKVDRLKQVAAYIDMLNKIESHPSLNQLGGAFPLYPEPIKQILAQPNSNLYAMRLRPSSQDGMLRTQNPTFTVNRDRDSGTFYHALMGVSVSHIATTSHKERFTQHVLLNMQSQKFPVTANTIFPLIAQTLANTHQQMFGDAFHVDFNISAEDINVLGYDADSKMENKEELNGIIHLLINRATETHGFPLESSFNELTVPVNKEKLSIMVQFLVGEINIYARSKKISQQNFGTVLDSNPHIAKTLAAAVKWALESDQGVEQCVCDFINNNKVQFGLNSQFTSGQVNEIFSRFNPHYQLVKESPHMDEFMILDQAGAEHGRFFTHQNNICFDFSDLMSTGDFVQFNKASNARVRDEVTRIPGIVPSRDNNAVGFFDIDIEELKVAIRAAINAENFTFARKILSVTESGKYVFEEFGREFFAHFDSNLKAEQLFLEVRRGITDANSLNRYNRVVRGLDAQILLTPEMARKLYVAVADTQALTPEKTLQYSTVDAVKALLSDLGIRNVTATPGYNGDIVLDTSTSGVEQITAILNAYTQSIHLTNSMAASLYKQVEESYGKESREYLAMMALNNQGETPLKLIKALELLHIGVLPKDITYPNNGRGLNGYIIRNIDAEALRTIEETHEFQGNRFVLSSAMEQALYDCIQRLDREAFNENLPNLSNAGRPDKLETALVLLGISFRRVEIHGGGEFVLFLPPAEQAKIKVIAHQNLNSEELGLTRRYTPEIMPPQRKSTRGYMLEMIRARARTAAVSDEEINIRRGEFQRRTRDEIMRVPTPVASVIPSDAVNQINISSVRGFGAVSTNIPLRINPGTAQINCPSHILSAFQEILRDTPILGAHYTNPYTNQVEQFPTQIEQLTPRHLQLLARNEAVNTDGVMKIQQYNGLLNENQIAGIRALVKATTTAGITYAERRGGYGSPIVALNPHHKVIVIDQSGLQWQGDKRNTGGLFFYPAVGAPGVPAGYADWQRNTYQAMFNVPRPDSSSHSLAVTWNGSPGHLDLNGVARGIELEFVQALDAAVAQGQYLDVGERINLAFLKAGMGFFASGLSLSSQNRQLLELARLQGVLHALQTIQRMPQEQRTVVLGRVGRIELPYSGGEGNAQLLSQIQTTVEAMGLEWGGATPTGGYFPRSGWVTATTNCGDPHAMPSNEGGYSSVDAEMGSNAYLDHLNATYNAQISIRLTPSFYPEGAEDTITVTNTEVASVAIPIPQATSNVERIEAALSQEINRLVQQRGGDIERGRWFKFTNGGIEHGRSNFSGLLGFATDAYQVTFEANGSISVQNKRERFTPIIGEARVNVLTDFCRGMNLQIGQVPSIQNTGGALSPTVDLGNQFIRGMLTQLISYISRDQSQEALNKSAKLRAISTWLERNPALSGNNRDVVLAFIRDVCSLRDGWMGFFQSPDSLTEFNRIMRQDPSTSLSRMGRFSFSTSELNGVVAADEHLDELIHGKLEQMNRNDGYCF